MTKGLVDQIHNIINLRINTLVQYKRLKDFQEQVDFLKSIEESIELSREKILKLIQMQKNDILLFGELYAKFYLTKKNIYNNENLIENSELPSIIKEPSFINEVKLHHNQSTFPIGIFQNLIARINHHFNQERVIINEYRDFSNKKKISELSQIKIQQLINLIKKEEYYLSNKIISSHKDMEHFKNNFQQYSYIFQEGFFFAHFTNNIKNILKTGALLS